MRNSDVFKSHFNEVKNLSSLLNNYVNSYRLLVGAAGELNNIYKVRKRDLDDALDRVKEMGEIIDTVLEIIKENEDVYIKYIRLKSEILNSKASKDIILTEVEEDLLFDNSTNREDE